MNFPASGHGQSSKYYDEDLLFDGTYNIISVTVHSSSRDDNNPDGDSILRKGLLLTVDPDHDGYYVPLSTADGYLNGDTPTQFMNDVVVLARKDYVDKDFILGLSRERSIDASHLVLPAYFSCNVWSNKIYYNNSTNTSITQDQWEQCQRIRRITAGTEAFEESESKVRALLWRRKETYVTPSELV